MTFNDPVYLPFWFLLMMVFAENATSMNSLIKDNIRYIKLVVFIWSLLVGCSIFIPSSYGIGWGDGTYFGSIPKSIWRLAPGACMIQMMLLICIAHDRISKYKYFICSLIPLYCGFMGGSRTYFIIIVFYFALFLYYYTDSVKQFRLYLAVSFLIGFLVFGFSGFALKIAATQYTQNSFFDFWGTVTNGRSMIWESDFEYFFNADLVQQIFGSGYDKIYEISMTSRLGAAVYAHNDFINIAIANGLAGLVLYLIPTLLLIKNFKQRFNGSKAILLLCIAIWLVNAMLNMAYTYTCAAISFAFLPRAIELCEESRQKIEKTDNGQYYVKELSDTRKCREMKGFGSNNNRVKSKH